MSTPQAAQGVPPDSAGPGDSIFEASAFERALGHSPGRRFIGWQRRMLVLAALLGCLGVFTLARWIAGTPDLDAAWTAGPRGELVLESSAQPALAALRGRTLVSVAIPGRQPVAVDGQLLHRCARCQVDDAARERQVAAHEALARLWAASGGTALLRFDDGTQVQAAITPRGFEGIGLPFWPLAGVALLLYLLALVLLMARPDLRSLLYVVMAWCQGGNLLFHAMESTRGLALPAGALALDMPVRMALDLCTGAAAVHAFALSPRRLLHTGRIAGAAWGGVALWLALAWAGWLAPLWWWAQGAAVALCAAALAVAGHSRSVEPNPYALVLRRMAAAALAGIVLETLVIALTAVRSPQAYPVVAGVASIAWVLFFSGLLLLTPFLARSRQMLREFALLAGVSTVATSLDLLFVAVFSFGAFTSLAIAVFAGVGLYAGARQWLLNQVIGTTLLTAERAFDQLYRAAREVQAHPGRYPHLLTQLLRDLFEPLEIMRVERVPERSRLVGGGAGLVVPMRRTDDVGIPLAAPGVALVLRFAQRGQRLFTLDDARLADRVVDQLRRAVAYDMAVERGRTEERQRIAQDLHDDIGARLLTLMYQAQTREMEDYIRHTLQDLKTLTRGLAASEHRLSHAAVEWKSDLTQRLSAARVTLNWQCTFDRDLRLSVVQWSALTRVLRELVSNALYHGRASQVDVSIALDGPRLMLQVADDGEGRDPSAWSHGLGLGGVRKRVKVLGGEVSWRENGPQGIVCTVRVPRFAGRA